MALSRPNFFKLLVPIAVFFAVLVTFTLINRSSAPPATPGAAAGEAANVPSGLSTDQRIQRLQSAVRSHPSDARSYSGLGDAYLQKVRETGDSGFYVRAQGAYRRSLELKPLGVDAVIGLGTLALARHDFRGGLRYGLEARRLAPGIVRSYGVVVDAQVELGRYSDAARTLQTMVNLKPNLASYARVSYFKELHGDLQGASQAMGLAVTAGGDTAENAAYVQSLLGNLEFDRGHTGAAREAYREALSRFPRYLQAGAGLARLDAAEGRFGPAIDRYRAIVGRLPLPEYVVGLGETELAAGRTDAGRRDLDLIHAEEQLLRSNGVNTDVELGLFEANHGDAHRAVALGRRAYADAPSVRSADALGWALTSSGDARGGLHYARKALRLGSRDPSFLYHAGMSALAAGNRSAARDWLGRALAVNPHLSPLYAPRAQQALKELG